MLCTEVLLLSASVIPCHGLGPPSQVGRTAAPTAMLLPSSLQDTLICRQVAQRCPSDVDDMLGMNLYVTCTPGTHWVLVPQGLSNGSHLSRF